MIVSCGDNDPFGAAHQAFKIGIPVYIEIINDQQGAVGGAAVEGAHSALKILLVCFILIAGDPLCGDPVGGAEKLPDTARVNRKENMVIFLYVPVGILLDLFAFADASYALNKDESVMLQFPVQFCQRVFAPVKMLAYRRQIAAQSIYVCAVGYRPCRR